MEPYADAARRIAAAALADPTAYRRLAYLCDRIGPRLSGSAGLDAAIRWSTETMRADGFDTVRAERVLVPRWVRGAESAELVAPRRQPLTMLGLGGSVATPKGGLVADVLVVADFEELKARAGDVPGKIVCFNAPFAGYGPTVRYRTAGPSEAARLGAVATLVRSVGPTSLTTPHTGSTVYAADAPKIPAAAITIEDAELLARTQARGDTPRVTLKMSARTLKDAPSANVLADLRGRERPDEIVLIGGHLDSWDVCPGAHDDAGGCLAAWEAARLLKTLDLRPRRTVRVVLFTNEENGLRGGNGYAKAHAAEASRHVLAVESDAGVTQPLGFGLSTKTPGGLARAQALLTPLLEPLGAGKISDGGGGADIGPMGALGVPTAGLNVDMHLYWSIHHTPADTIDKVKPEELAKCVAAMATLAYVAAEQPERF